jgi:hypothetical protein
VVRGPTYSTNRMTRSLTPTPHRSRWWPSPDRTTARPSPGTCHTMNVARILRCHLATTSSSRTRARATNGRDARAPTSAAARMNRCEVASDHVQRALDHRSAGFTLSVYGHLFDEHLDELASALDGTSRGTGAVQSIMSLAEKGPLTWLRGWDSNPQPADSQFVGRFGWSSNHPLAASDASHASRSSHRYRR